MRKLTVHTLIVTFLTPVRLSKASSMMTAASSMLGKNDIPPRRGIAA